MENQLKVKGTIISIMDAIQGENWIKQEFQIRTDGEYPQINSFIAFNTSQNQLSRCKVNDHVTVFFNIESRMYKDKWYTDLKAWRINITFNKPE